MIAPLPTRTPPRPSLRRVAGSLTAVVLVSLLTVLGLPASAAPAPAPTTIVSLTFDDGNADQLLAADALDAVGLRGTFYIVPGVTGTPGYLSRADLARLAAAGHEIGGHTVNHPDLTTVSADEAARQVCGARNTLTDWGLPQRSFAYPYAALDSGLETIVKNCGYSSARGLGDLRSQAGCSDCDYAGRVPPSNPYALKALDQVDTTWTLADLKQSVLNAESTGGWVIFTFHHVCGGAACDELSVDPAVFTAFSTWLADRTAAGTTTQVRTVGDVIGGAVAPPVTPPAPPAVSGALSNASFESVAGGVPACFTSYPWGVNDAALTMVDDAHTGTAAARLTIDTYTSGAVALLPTFDAGGCTPSAAAGASYAVGAWYRSSVPVQFVAYLRDAQGGFAYWTSGPYLPASESWTRATWVTPPLPAGATGISAGLSLFHAGSVTIDDIAIVDSATLPPEVPPTAMGNASLEEPGVDGMPQCWTPSVFGAHDAVFTGEETGHTGERAVTVSITNYTDGAAHLLPTMYGSTCAPAASAGNRYELSAWYRSTTTTQFTAYYLAADGTWTYWTASPFLDAASSWTQASWATPALPAGATRVAFGLTLLSVGSLTTDDYGFVEIAGDTPPADDGDTPPAQEDDPPADNGDTPPADDGDTPPASGSTGSTGSTTTPSGPAQSLPGRIAGSNRYATAAALAREFGSAASVVIANGSAVKQGFDALAANYLAGRLGAPILLTEARTLPAETAAALRALLAGAGATPLTVWVIGKTDSVSEAVSDRLNAIARAVAGDTRNHIVRIGGNSRYDTAVALAALGGTDPSGTNVRRHTIGADMLAGRTAFLASGTSNADALAAGPLSGLLGIPVYLTQADRLPASVAAALKSQAITNVIVLGGRDRVPDAVVSQVRAAGVVEVHRIAGSDRYETSALLQAFARSTLRGVDGSHYGSAGPSPVFLANGTTGFPDALAVGPLAARRHAALLTVARDALPASVAAFLAEFRSDLGPVTSLGTTATVSDAASSAARAALR